MAEESSGQEMDSLSEDKMPKYLDFPPEDEAEDQDRGDRIRTVISFFGVGLILHTLFSVVIAGSQDLLGGTKIPTTAVILSHMGPMVLVIYTMPWIMQKISYFCRVLTIFAFMAAGFVVISFVQNPYVKLFGVALNAVAHALGEATFLALGAFYGEISVTSFSAGAGVGILVGPLYYLGLTSGICISPQETMIIISFGSLILLVCYYILNKDRVKSHAIAATYSSQKYSSVPSKEIHDPMTLSWSEKFSAAWKILPLMLSLGVTQLIQYLTMQAVFTTLGYTSTVFTPRDHYVLYVSFYGAGEFLSRSYLSVIFCCRPSLAFEVTIYKTWIPTIMAAGIFVLSVCIAWFRFVESTYLIMFLAFLIGIITGCVYSNTLVAVQETVEPRYEEFCLGLVTLGNNTGAFIASFVGLWLEPILRRHCERMKHNSPTCLTRYTKVKWTQAICNGKAVEIKIEI